MTSSAPTGWQRLSWDLAWPGMVPVGGAVGNLVTWCGCGEICVGACGDRTALGQPSSYGNRARGTMITEEDRAKPPELVSLYAATSAAFKILKEEFQVPDVYELALHHVDAAELRLTNTVDIAAIAMRKVQALRWVAKPGVETTNDVVVALAADLSRALDHLVQHCSDQATADSLTKFKYQVVVAARHAGGDGSITRLR
jgi:hypothetical protein